MPGGVRGVTEPAGGKRFAGVASVGRCFYLPMSEARSCFPLEPLAYFFFPRAEIEIPGFVGQSQKYRVSEKNLVFHVSDGRAFFP